ncbi:hypothetical protein [Candidatus Chloroploca asiatica]|uniref:hypothetical protein n=1 Tax=Candidatus Chloroploca asiatica TaxID=1506545 RepID=UPI001142E56E|nr:hypothetical protein [Candidatus Chloroploca asiatica]
MGRVLRPYGHGAGYRAWGGGIGSSTGHGIDGWVRGTADGARDRRATTGPAGDHRAIRRARDRRAGMGPSGGHGIDGRAWDRRARAWHGGQIGRASPKGWW